MTALRRTLLGLGGLSLLGLAISLYLTWSYLAGSAPVCLGGTGCATVQASPYARIAGVPLPIAGALLYLGMVILTRFALARPGRAEGPLLALFGASLAGALFSLYLTAVARFVIQATCLWCLASAVTIVAACGLSVRALRQFHAQR